MLKHLNKARAAVAALAVILPLAGFTCPLSQEFRDNVARDEEAGAPQATAITPEPVWIDVMPDGTFRHVQPGVMSEFYVDFTTGPGDDDTMLDPNDPGPMIAVDLDGPGVMRDEHQTLPFEPNKEFHVIFPINAFGNYTPSVTVLDGGTKVFDWSLVKEVE